MPQATAPFILNKVSLTLVKTKSIGTDTPVDFRCQLSRAEIVPSTTGGATNASMDTFCGSYNDTGAGSSSFTLELAGFQAWQDVADFSVISWNEEGELFTFELVPFDHEQATSVTNPSFTGEVTMVATPVGGTAKQYAQFTASLPCTEKPTMVTA